MTGPVATGDVPASMVAEPSLESLDASAAVERALDDLRQSRLWSVARRVEGIALSSGFLPGVPTRVYRSDVELDVRPERLVRLLADDSFEELARWSAEFMHGEWLETLLEEPTEAVWVVRASYRTPVLLSHREYVYRFARCRVDGDRTLILYRSIALDLPVQSGFVRAVLYPTAHLVQALPGGRSRLEHVLATDLRGWFPAWLQKGPLEGAMLDAHARDTLAQRRVWSGPRPA